MNDQVRKGRKCPCCGKDQKYLKERIFVDATPDDYYPLRILRMYRMDCNTSFSGSGNKELIEVLNKLQRKRARILDKAIKLLSKEDDGSKS